jgi:anthranilate synthase component 1
VIFIINPPFREFLSLSSHFNLIPVSSHDIGDTETPISIYLKLKTSGQGPSFLLESLEGGATHGRYSFIGLDPLLIYKHKNGEGQVTFTVNNQDRVIKKYGPPTRILDSLLSNYKVPEMAGLEHFHGGAVGYFGYDIIRTLERLPTPPPDPIGLPDCIAMIPGTLIVLDHMRNVTKIIVMAEPQKDKPDKAYDRAIKRIEEIKDIISTVHPLQLIQEPLRFNPESIITNLPRKDYFKRVERALEYIKSGDILQVVLSRRYSLPYSGNPLDIFRRLRSLNPSPYMFYLDFGDPVILGASPEMLIRVNKREIYTRPIAGTRPRNKDPRKDKELADELLLDEKERAEHLMLVDLGRNDLGRVCTPGSVEVPDFMRVERFSHVMHLVSDVKGVLGEEISPLQAFEACFPAGTVSGAPKVRAMEIIDELEPCRRGIYAGAVGYAGFNNILDTAISIRTLVFSRKTAHIQAGGGIVADSIPEKEYLETVNKAGALLQAMGIEKERGLVHGIND